MSGQICLSHLDRQTGWRSDSETSRQTVRTIDGVLDLVRPWRSPVSEKPALFEPAAGGEDAKTDRDREGGRETGGGTHTMWITKRSSKEKSLERLEGGRKSLRLCFRGCSASRQSWIEYHSGGHRSTLSVHLHLISLLVSTARPERVHTSNTFTDVLQEEKKTKGALRRAINQSTSSQSAGF